MLQLCNIVLMPDYITKKADGSQTIGYIVYLLFGVLDIFLVFRLIFKLLGANPSSNFVGFIYSVTEVFAMPFTGIFRQATTQGIETTSVFEPATFVAIIVYALLAWGITQIVVIISGRPH